jgi:hypothetical protein
MVVGESPHCLAEGRDGLNHTRLRAAGETKRAALIQTCADEDVQATTAS